MLVLRLFRGILCADSRLEDPGGCEQELGIYFPGGPESAAIESKHPIASCLSSFENGPW